VTGASSGIGREFALALAERGTPVLAVARDGERLGALADEVAHRGGRLEPLSADLSRPEGVESLLAAAADREVELLVNNAGAASYGPFVTLSPERETELLRLNVEAVVALTHGLLPAMLERGRGGVINSLAYTRALAKRIKLVGLDVDGVFTDGGLYIGLVANHPLEFKRFHVLDGLGVKLFRTVGLTVVLLVGAATAEYVFPADELPPEVDPDEGDPEPAPEPLSR